MADNVEDSSVGFLYKLMHSRAPNKRRVKPVPQHKMMMNFGGLDDSSDDSDFEIGKKKKGSQKDKDSSDDDDDDDDDSADDDIDDDESVRDEEEDEDNDGKSSGEESTEDEEEEEATSEVASGSMMIHQSVSDYLAQTKDRLLQCENSKAASEETMVSSVSSRHRHIKMSICYVCLGDISKEDNEVVDCDGCGVSVHEGCYGITESGSVSSTVSSASTEPWFCDACKSGVKQPMCELCPNSGGLFKETDAGKWVHLVCALYVPGVAFGNVDLLTNVTLFEMQYSKWGAKECSLCEDVRYSRCGVCIGCDAGMCRNFFHVTCAQREGLLSEASPEEDIADPFYAYCKQHVDKSVMRTKRRNWLAVQSHMKQLNARPVDNMDTQEEKSRVQRKLIGHQNKYLEMKAVRPPSWVPPEKLARPLSSCPHALKRLLRKAELLGISSQTHSHATASTKDIRKKWHIQPAFSAEFVTYVLDRDDRMSRMKAHTSDLIAQKEKLQTQERLIRSKYEKLSNDVETLNVSIDNLRDEGEKVWKILAVLGKKPLKIPELVCPKKQIAKPKNASVKRMGNGDVHGSGGNAVIHNCRVCKKSSDQHLLAHCDTCSQYLHLACLEPPLTRMPKKSKLYGWQCSECCKTSSDDDPDHVAATAVATHTVADTVDVPRRLRESIKEPQKFTPETIGGAEKKRDRSKGKRKKKAPVKEPPESSAPPPPHPPPPTLDQQQQQPPQEEEEHDHSEQVKVKKNTARKSTTPRPQQQREEKNAECAMCYQPGDNTNLVKCDECALSYHFHCLQPPQTRTPRIRGYSWMCMACQSSESESEEDEEDNEEQEEETSSKPASVRKVPTTPQKATISPIVVEISDSEEEEIHSNVSHTLPINEMDDLDADVPPEVKDEAKVAALRLQPRKRQKTARMKEYLGIETEEDEDEEMEEEEEEEEFVEKTPKKRRKTSPKASPVASNHHLASKTLDNGRTVTLTIKKGMIKNLKSKERNGTEDS